MKLKNYRKFNEQETNRINKLKNLGERNIDPYGHAVKRTENSEKLKTMFDRYSKEELTELNITTKSLAGRIMTKRAKGKAGFLNIQDQQGQIQIYVRRDTVGEEDFTVFSDSDLGDIIWVQGSIIKTNTGELSIKAVKFRHLVKCISPLPDKYHGLVDVEEKQRKRYLDLIVNPGVKELFIARSKVIQTARNYFIDDGYLEVETPILQPIAGGATAKPFITEHNVLKMSLYLRIAPELYLKRLLIGGFDKVFEIGRLFRNEGISIKHNPEFTSIEAYCAYGDYNDAMNLVENLFMKLIKEFHKNTIFKYQDLEINATTPWKKIKQSELIEQITGVNFEKVKTFEQAVALAKKHNVELQNYQNTIGHIQNEFFEKKVEHTIVNPTFVTQLPSAVSTLSLQNKDNPDCTDRFELFLGGREYVNGFSEQNSSFVQYEKFEEQIVEKNKGNSEAVDMDHDYINALEYGLPPAFGIGIGVDRLIMLLTNTRSIREIILFPHARKKNEK